MSEIKTWPGWQYVRLIGEGAFGKVYEIRREDSQMEAAALKVIPIPQTGLEYLQVRMKEPDDKSVEEHFRRLIGEIVGIYDRLAACDTNSREEVASRGRAGDGMAQGSFEVSEKPSPGKKKHPLPILLAAGALILTMGGGAFFFLPGQWNTETKEAASQSAREETGAGKEAEPENERKSVIYNIEGDYTTKELDEKGRDIKRSWYGPNGVFEFSYDFTYNEEDYTSVSIRHDADGSENGRIKYRYDENWNAISSARYTQKGKLSYSRQHLYDENGNLTEIARYDAKGVLNQRVMYTPAGAIEARYRYNKKGKLTEQVQIEPDESGNPLKILCSDGKGKVKYRYEFTYDEQGYRTSSVSYRGEETKVCRIVYEPNMQECRQASLTVYNPDGSVKSEETTDDMKKLEIPSVGKEE